MCSAAPQWLSHTREGKITLDSLMFAFPTRLGNLKKKRTRSQLALSILVSLPLLWGSKARNRHQEQLPNSLPPAPTQQRTRRISVPLPNGPSLLCRTQLSLQSLCTPDIEVFRSLCSFFTSQGKEHVLRPLSRQLRSLNMLSIMWLDNGQGNMGNH